MVEPNTCMGLLPPGPSGIALNGQPSQSLRDGSKAPTLHCSHPEDNFPLQCRAQGALVVLSMAVPPQKVAPELLSPWLSTEPPRAQAQEALKLCWHRQGRGGSTGEKVVY